MNKDEVLTKSLDEFMEFYKITDNEKIYSNGIDYVPIFRVKQWEEYNNKDQEIERLYSIIKEVREMLEHKVEFHKNLDFYKDKELETQVYYNYVACLQDFDEIVEKYKVEENK